MRTSTNLLFFLLAASVSTQSSTAALLRGNNANKQNQRQLAEMPCLTGVTTTACTSSENCYGKCRVFQSISRTTTGCDDTDAFIGTYPAICEAPPSSASSTSVSSDGDSGDADSGDADSGDADSGDADSGDADSGDADSGDADSGDVDSGDADSGDADSGIDRQSECIAIGSEIYNTALEHNLTDCETAGDCSRRLCRLVVGRYMTCDETDAFGFLNWPPVCEETQGGETIDDTGEDADTGDGDNNAGTDNGDAPVRICVQATTEQLNHTSTTCTSSGQCSTGSCRIMTDFLACDEGDHLTDWPKVCDTIQIDEISDDTSDDTDGDIEAPEESVIEVEEPVVGDEDVTVSRTCVQATTEQLNHTSTTCTSSGQCSTGSCRIMNDFLACDEGDHLTDWPKVCDTIDIPDDGTDNDGGDNGAPVRSNCLETTSSNYIAALGDTKSACETNGDCSAGLCLLIAGEWLECDEGDNFGSLGWLSVCNEEEVPVRQPSQPNCVDVDSDDYVEARDDIATVCTSNGECNSGPCRLVDGNYFACDDGNHFGDLNWPEVCDEIDV